MGVKNVFLLCYPQVLSLFKLRVLEHFGTKKKSSPNRCSPLNSSTTVCLCGLFLYFVKGNRVLKKKLSLKVFFFLMQKKEEEVKS